MSADDHSRSGKLSQLPQVIFTTILVPRHEMIHACLALAGVPEYVQPDGGCLGGQQPAPSSTGRAHHIN